MKIKKGFVKRKIGDDYLVVTVGELSKTNGIMITLNETSSDIWDMVEKGYTKEKIAEELTKLYNVSLEKAALDTEKVINLMAENGIIEE